MISILETVTPEGGVTEILRHEARPGQERLEAPNWWPGGGCLIVNSGGRLWRITPPGISGRFWIFSPTAPLQLEPISTGIADRCNNDHLVTRRGQILFGSHFEAQGAQIYTVPRLGIAPDARPQKISDAAPSWLHGISPNGRLITYVAARGGSRGVDVYTRALRGGVEQRLTQGEGHSDGPDFSHNGRRIYWNSDRSGHAQIWVMDADGQNQRQLFRDDRVNWFPHPSPCGRWLVWLSYPPGTEGHPADLPVRLMISDPEGGNQRVLREFTGGQGTINVPSWAPDGHAFAYIRYEP